MPVTDLNFGAKPFGAYLFMWRTCASHYRRTLHASVIPPPLPMRLLSVRVLLLPAPALPCELLTCHTESVATRTLLDLSMVVACDMTKGQVE